MNAYFKKRAYLACIFLCCYFVSKLPGQERDSVSCEISALTKTGESGVPVIVKVSLRNTGAESKSVYEQGSTLYSTLPFFWTNGTERFDVQYCSFVELSKSNKGY